MNDPKVVLYYSWSRPGETGALLEVIENRFPALFESRRMLHPRFEDLSIPPASIRAWRASSITS